MLISLKMLFVLLFPCTFSPFQNVAADLVWLDWENIPQFTMDFSVGKTRSYFFRTNAPGFNISVEIAKMTVEDCGKAHPSISIVHLGKQYLDFCGTSINSPVRHPFAAGSHGFTGEVDVKAVGRWAANDEAVVVATIYKDNCLDCPAESNCGRGLAGIMNQPDPMRNQSLRLPCPSSGCLCIPSILKDMWTLNASDQLNLSLDRANCTKIGKIQVLAGLCAYLLLALFSLKI